MFHPKTLLFIILTCAISLLGNGQSYAAEDMTRWETLSAKGAPTARHEASFVAYKDKLYLIGGRRINPVDVFDPTTNSWTEKSKTPIELHHFQSVVIDDAIYIVGAMTGAWPNEKPLDRVIIYYPDRDVFEYGHKIPKARRRGGAGAVYHDGKIYMIGGIDNGHMNGYQNWFDEYDPKTGKWRILPNAPHKRDHFSAAVVDNKLYAFAGRKTEHAIGNDFGPTHKYGDIFDFQTGKWESASAAPSIPTRRAGNMILAWNNSVIIGGGESDTQIAAHDEVEAFDTVSKTWHSWPKLNQGRHGSGFAVIGNYVYTASGCGKRGGEPELTSIERLKLPQQTRPVTDITNTSKPTHQQWHTVTLNFKGPQTSETDAVNPFTDYRLMVEFQSEGRSYLVRGFYAADGNAAQTSADSGNIWQVRFTPDHIGEWTYKASFRKGKNIAINRDLDRGTNITLPNANGTFMVMASDKNGSDFRVQNRGRLKKQAGYFQFEQSKQHWLKGGPNSPENLLGYSDFDGTYRIEDEIRDGEAQAGGSLHNFTPHLRDWEKDDPTWGDDKGKALIGAMNYLAEEGMNTVYFLTLNILGDGKDVWPYRNPKDVMRFDVSKLEQWNILFDHMQAKGILLHIVMQETENELLLDDGDTGLQRSLYYSELIARFAHHPALVWNLGEENGPVHWRPEGQNDAQRKAMAQYFENHDPYGHIVLLHTHSQAHEKDDIAGPLLGFKPLDGLSFQISDRETVNAETRKWRKLAQDSGHDWVITMDEIGMWHTGAVPDSMNPRHDSLRRHALWGHLLGGGGGVEWYFGAKFPSNDLTSEDWRLRQNLWRQTRYALDFFTAYLPYWDMQACENIIDRKDAYCSAKYGEVYAIYLPEGGTGILNLPEDEKYNITWYNPISGGDLQKGSIATVIGANRVELGMAPDSNGKDWVVLIQKK